MPSKLTISKYINVQHCSLYFPNIAELERKPPHYNIMSAKKKYPTMAVTFFWHSIKIVHSRASRIDNGGKSIFPKKKKKRKLNGILHMKEQFFQVFFFSTLQTWTNRIDSWNRLTACLPDWLDGWQTDNTTTLSLQFLHHSHGHEWDDDMFVISTNAVLFRVSAFVWLVKLIRQGVEFELKVLWVEGLL